MFEIPFNFILISPAVDILIFLTLAYFLLFKYYKILLNKNIEKIIWVDLQATTIFLSLGYLNYSDSLVDIFGFEMEWWFYILLVQFLVEGSYAIFNLKDTREYFKKIKKSNKEKEEENLIEVISSMKSVLNLMEEDLNKYKIQGNREAVEKIESEMEKIEINIKELEEKLKDLKLEKND